jgi:heat shock protein HtpX
MATLYTEQSNNIYKTWGLMTGFFIMIIFLGWFMSLYLNNPVILWFFVGFSILMNIFSYWFSDRAVLAMSGARPVSRESHKDLWNILENLCISSGMMMPALYIINDPSPNAFATGRDEKHAAIAVTSGLLQILDRSELEGVVAHELAHIKNRDTLVMTVVVILVGLITLISDFLLRFSFYNNGESKKVHPAVIIAGFVLAALSPVIAMVIKFSVSRKREFLADASGALLTRYPEGLANALQKISSYPVEIKRANHATAHMYIASPFRGKGAAGFWSKMFMTHPPIEERVRALLRNK